MFLERSSGYWVTSASGRREKSLFERIVTQVWNWVQASQSIRWFTDGERRYGQELWNLASVWLDRHSWPVVYDIRKAWREGLEVAMKVKGSQGKARREWVKFEHPWTAISAESEVHANHCEAHNAALRRRCSAFRRRQNLYAKTPSGLERALSVQRLIHNWVRPR
ncbi:hypothetical protein CKA32_005298 [Geitlerinema sp. FC II]|nr:hypothetical protein CKA32_005298 [Geitlerinema sp. FC II]